MERKAKAARSLPFKEQRAALPPDLMKNKGPKREIGIAPLHRHTHLSRRSLVDVSKQRKFVILPHVEIGEKHFDQFHDIIPLGSFTHLPRSSISSHRPHLLPTASPYVQTRATSCLLLCSCNTAKVCESK